MFNKKEWVLIAALLLLLLLLLLASTDPKGAEPFPFQLAALSHFRTKDQMRCDAALTTTYM
jgi:hypothetical protein